MNATVRAASRDDAGRLLALVDALADYEQLARPDAEARQRLTRDAFDASPRFRVLLAEADSIAVGYALYFETYSSFLARPTLYLEDLFVLPAHRGAGHGKRLFAAVAAEARARGCGRMEWSVLRWNRLALDFYDALGAHPLEEWQTYRLDGGALERLSAASEAA